LIENLVGAGKSGAETVPAPAGVGFAVHENLSAFSRLE